MRKLPGKLAAFSGHWCGQDQREKATREKNMRAAWCGSPSLRSWRYCKRTRNKVLAVESTSERRARLQYRQLRRLRLSALYSSLIFSLYFFTLFPDKLNVWNRLVDLRNIPSPVKVSGQISLNSLKAHNLAAIYEVGHHQFSHRKTGFGSIEPVYHVSKL